MKEKHNKAPAKAIRQESDPAKMRDNIIRLFDSLPDDTRDIIAQFWLLTIQEQLPEWKKRGDAARKTNTRRPGGTDADPGGLAPAT